MAALASRMAKELKKLDKHPPPGISAFPIENSIRELQVQLQGPTDSPYELGLFKLSVTVPDRYPFEPPKVQFTTPVYHPNIDAQGRICLDYLNMPPKGSWSPAMDLYKVLVAIRQLLAEPNPRDPLEVAIAEEYVSQPEVFKAKARQHVAQNASPQAGPPRLADTTLDDVDANKENTRRQQQCQQQQQQGLEQQPSAHKQHLPSHSQPQQLDDTNETAYQVTMSLQQTGPPRVGVPAAAAQHN